MKDISSNKVSRQTIAPVYVDVLGTAYFVTPFLRAHVHAGVEVCVVENDRVCVKHRSKRRAASVGQHAAKHSPVPVERLHALLWKTAPDDKHAPRTHYDNEIKPKTKKKEKSIQFASNCVLQAGIIILLKLGVT